MAYKPSDDPLINLEFYNKFLILKDPAFYKAVEGIVDADLMRWYLFTEKVYLEIKEWQELMDEPNQEALIVTWDVMLKALEAVFQNYVSLKYECSP